jgi:hypothetical protein
VQDVLGALEPEQLERRAVELLHDQVSSITTMALGVFWMIWSENDSAFSFRKGRHISTKPGLAHGDALSRQVG